MNRGLVHFMLAGVVQPFLRIVKEPIAKHVGDPRRTCQGLWISCGLMPQQKADHGVVVPPRIPWFHLRQAEPLAVGSSFPQTKLLWPWTQIAVLGLKCHGAGYEFLDSLPEPGVTGQPDHLGRSGEILAEKLTGPWKQLSIGLLVLVCEHVEHRGIVPRRRNEPVLNNALDLPAQGAANLECGAGVAFESRCDTIAGRRLTTHASRRRQRRNGGR